MALFLAMACLTALMVALPMALYDYLGIRRTMVRNQAILADAVSSNSTAALIFHDSRSAEEILSALRAEPSVVAACIYDDTGKPFAKYVRDHNVSFLPPPAQPPLILFKATRLVQFRNIVLDKETVGAIYIESDLSQLDATVRAYSIVFIAMLLLALLLAAGIAPWLQRPISQPLVDLVGTATAISNNHDYSIRSHLKSSNEFGLLVTAFNGMLDQIEARDQQLRDHREQLEREVSSRTAELVVANAQIRQAEEKYRAIFEDAVIGIFQATLDGRPMSINRALAQIHGYDSPEQLMAEVPNVVAELFVCPEQMSKIALELESKGILRDIQVELYRRDRSKRWVVANLRAVRDRDGKLSLIEGTMEDITERKLAEEQVQYLAFYDALTGLPNRTLLRDRLINALANARRRNEKVALLFVDLDRFKIINDSLGHSCGDLLLQQVAERFKKSAREQDTVSRIGGDEFVIAMSGVKDIPDIAVAAERIMDAMAREFVIQDHRFNVSCSMGISIYPDHGLDSETLIKNADAAMYCAKESGRCAFRMFTQNMNAQVMERLTIESNLRTALEKQQFFLVYQPQLDLASQKIIGFEALLRWRHPEMGLVAPDRFIRVAENSGLILPIGKWVLRTACSAARHWQTLGLPAVPVAVNVSAVQFRQEDFLATTRSVLRETGLAPQYLEIELTESVLLSNAELTLPVLHELKTMGVNLAIDDFGTGYSSLSYLRQFPVSRLKIDRSFIKAVALNPDDAAITSAIISLGKSLNVKVIAEGVENESQFSFLRSHECDEIQGYYFSQPLTQQQVEEKLKTSPDALVVAAMASPSQE